MTDTGKDKSLFYVLEKVLYTPVYMCSATLAQAAAVENHLHLWKCNCIYCKLLLLIFTRILILL